MEFLAKVGRTVSTIELGFSLVLGTILFAIGMWLMTKNPPEVTSSDGSKMDSRMLGGILWGFAAFMIAISWLRRRLARNSTAAAFLGFMDMESLLRGFMGYGGGLASPVFW